MERAASLEAADALIAKLTPETGAKHVYGIDALEVKEEGSDGAGAGGGGGEDDDSEGSESDDDDDKDKGDRRAKNLLSDMWVFEFAPTSSLSVSATCSRPWHTCFRFWIACDWLDSLTSCRFSTRHMHHAGASVSLSQLDSI
jgi:hypothetical protein